MLESLRYENILSILNNQFDEVPVLVIWYFKAFTSFVYFRLLEVDVPLHFRERAFLTDLLLCCYDLVLTLLEILELHSLRMASLLQYFFLALLNIRLFRIYFILRVVKASLLLNQSVLFLFEISTLLTLSKLVRLVVFPVLYFHFCHFIQHFKGHIRLSRYVKVTVNNLSWDVLT